MSRLSPSTTLFLRFAEKAALDAWRLLRDYGMLGLSAVVLLAAGALALGAFGITDQGRPQSGVSSVTEPQPPVTVAGVPVAPMVLTYYLVASEAQQALLYSLENQMWNREYLQKSKIEVIVARNREEEEAAYREIAAARGRSLLTRVVVEDLRAR